MVGWQIRSPSLYTRRRHADHNFDSLPAAARSPVRTLDLRAHRFLVAAPVGSRHQSICHKSHTCIGFLVEGRSRKSRVFVSLERWQGFPNLRRTKDTRTRMCVVAREAIQGTALGSDAASSNLWDIHTKMFRNANLHNRFDMHNFSARVPRSD